MRKLSNSVIEGLHLKGAGLGKDNNCSGIMTQSTTLPTTAWLKLSNHTRGLDPLGAQAPAINIYGQLLPGITNVTDRARYYSFYPWMIRTYEQLTGEKTYESLRDWVRRCDCLFTMIGVRHAQVLDDGDHNRHEGALIGTNTLRKEVFNLDASGVLQLADYVPLDNDNGLRYFKNPLGGLQQYYIGTFVGLDLMRREGRGVANTNEYGVPLAEAMDAFVDRELFVATVQLGEVTAEVLDALAAFCPCRLQESSAEHAALLDLFFARPPHDDEHGLQRRNTLGLMLDLVHALAAHGGEATPFDHHTFRACVYTGALPDGTAWELPPHLEKARQQWRTYQKHELLSAAAQCFFWVALRKIDTPHEHPANTQQFMRWFEQQPETRMAAERLGAGDFPSLLQATGARLPELGDWQDSAHEMQLAFHALEGCNEKHPGEHATILEQAGSVLLALLARDEQQTPAYAPLEFAPGFFSLYPLNLEVLRQHAATTWAPMTTPQWLAWLAGYWGVEAHLRVAMRKLRYQNQETLHVLPTDEGLVVQELPAPTYTTPRFRQAVQILEDVGAIIRGGGNEDATLTHLGETLRGEIHG